MIPTLSDQYQDILRERHLRIREPKAAGMGYRVYERLETPRKIRWRKRNRLSLLTVNNIELWLDGYDAGFRDRRGVNPREGVQG